MRFDHFDLCRFSNRLAEHAVDAQVNKVRANTDEGSHFSETLETHACSRNKIEDNRAIFCQMGMGQVVVDATVGCKTSLLLSQLYFGHSISHDQAAKFKTCFPSQSPSGETPLQNLTKLKR